MSGAAAARFVAAVFSIRFSFFLFRFSLALPFSLIAQSLPVFRATTDVVAVPVTVTDRAGRFVSGLAADQFELTDAGERRAITQFTTERVPVSLGILLDISGSMATDPKARAADDARWADTRRALELLVQRLDPRDEVLFAAFADKVWLAVPWTRDHHQVPRAFNTLKPNGYTAMFDAVKLIAPAFQRAAYRAARCCSSLPTAATASCRAFAAARLLFPAHFARGTGADRDLHRQKALRDVAIGATQRAVTDSGAAVYAIGMGTGRVPMSIWRISSC